MSYRLILTFLTFCLFAVSNNAIANTGKATYAQCIACHGEKGEGNNAVNAPAIAGQLDWYLQRQISNFQSGLRGSHKNDVYGAQMSAMIKQVNEKDIADLVSYIAALEPVPNIASAGDLKNGMSYYQGKCGGCHGGNAEGNAALNSPKLTGLSSEYLSRQMDNFIKGVRGTEQQDKYGRQMAMMAKIAPQKELKDIIAFITAQNSKK